MPSTSVKPQSYPWTTVIIGKSLTLRLMDRSDLDRSVQFARTLPEGGLMFLTIDITDAKAMEPYIQAIEAGMAWSVLAEVDGRFVGYGSLAKSQPTWTRHLGEIRLLVSHEMRGYGLGSLLTKEACQLASEHGVQKMVARMAVEQKGAAQLFERLGFRTEALLNDFVMDRNGRPTT
jgi:L-amino acid N-acyltransferase YncA